MNKMPENITKRKLRIYFPEVEAGYGHIMTCRAIKEMFEKKYSDEFEIISNDFFESSENKLVKKYGKLLIQKVQQYTQHPGIGIFEESLSILLWPIAMWTSMHVPFPGSVRAGIKDMEKIEADIVFSTHWVTNYYAMKIKENRPFSILYCPDVKLNSYFRTKSDITLFPVESGYEKIQKSIFYKNKISLVPFCVKNEIFDLYNKKDTLRKELSIDPDKFMLVLAEGGYGNGKIGKMVELLLKENLPITIVAFTGKNITLYEKIKSYDVPSNTVFIPFGFSNDILKYIACADLFSGKSGSMICEPTFFGVPSLITGCSTVVEINNAKYYSKVTKTAIVEKNPKRAVKLIKDFLANPHLLDTYKENCRNFHQHYNVEKTADYLYDIIQNHNLGK